MIFEEPSATMSVMTPEVLYRVTIEEAIKINKEGYIEPHNPNSRYGNSIPMIARRDLLSISHLYANPVELKSRNLDYFILLAFRTRKLENLIDVQDISITTYCEYYAMAPICSLINAMKFQWLTVEKEADRYRIKSFGKSVKYLGNLDITPSSQVQLSSL